MGDDVRAVLGNEDELVGDALELLHQVVVLAAARRAEGDATGVQLVDERPELVVDLLRVVDERPVHVRGDQPDVRTRAHAGELRQVVRVRVGHAPYFRAASAAGAVGPTFSNTQKAQLLPRP